MTRFILFFTFFKIFLTCSSLAATVEEEAPNPTHTVLKQTFKTLQLWNAVPISLQESFTQRFPAPFALLDALDSFDKITREILRIPGISRKASAERVKKAIEEKHSVSSSDNFVFPVIPRFIDKEELLNSVWDSLKSTPYGEIIIRENRGGLLKDSIIFYGLFFVSFQDYGCRDDISGFIVIKNFFLAGAPGSPLQIRTGFMNQANEHGLVQQRLLTAQSSACTFLTDGRSARESLSITLADMTDNPYTESPASLNSNDAQASEGMGSPAVPVRPSDVPSPRGEGLPAPRGKDRVDNSSLREPLLDPKDRTSYTEPSHTSTETEKNGCCCSIQ